MSTSFISLHSLPRVFTRGKKRAGRGYGSGKGGHTSGRGQKGQRSRRTIPWSFEGGALPLSQRLPFWRGKGRLNPLKPSPAIVNVGDLERLKEGTAIDMAILIKEGFLTAKESRVQNVKILGRGKLTKKLTIVELAVSMPARVKIEKAGGEIQGLKAKGQEIKEEAPAKKNLGPSEKNQGSSEKAVKVAKMAEKKKTVEHKTIEKPVKKVIKAVKKSTVKTSKKITRKTSPKKKSVKKTSK